MKQLLTAATYVAVGFGGFAIDAPSAEFEQQLLLLLCLLTAGCILIQPPLGHWLPRSVLEIGLFLSILCHMTP